MSNHKLLFIFLLFFFSCASPEKEKSSYTTATLRGPSAISMIKMIAEPESSDSGLEARFLIRNEPNHVRAMMLAEEVDFAVLPSTMAALMYNRNGRYILAAIPVWGTLYLFGSDSTVHDWDDLKGKKVSLMARGMTPDIMFRYLAKKNGLNPDKDMELDYSFPTHTELANAVTAGITDLGVISEPMVSLAMKKNPSVRPIIDFNQEWKELFGDQVPFAQTALLVRKEFARKNPALVRKYLKNLENSIQWVNENPEKAASLIVEYEILPDEQTAEEAIPRCNLKYSQAWKVRSGIEEYFKVFYNFSPLILGGSLPDEEFYYKPKDL